MIKVAVIGGGCGGCASTFYIDKFFREGNCEVNIKLFESSALIGGRLRHVVIEDENLSVELGGNIFHDKVNPNVVNLMNDVKSELADQENDHLVKYLDTYNPYSNIHSTAIFNGKSCDVILGGNNLLNALKEWLDDTFGFSFGVSTLIGYINSAIDIITTTVALIRRYGFGSLRATKSYQTSGVPMINRMFSKHSVDEFSHFVDMHFPGALFKSCRSVMQTELSISEQFVSEILESVSRNIYSQSLDDYHQMAMITTLMAADDTGLKCFKNGNSNFFKTAAESAKNATVLLNHKVTKVEKLQSGKFKVTHNYGEEEFDYVVICVPLEVATIELVNIQVQSDLISEREFVGCHIAIVRGKINPNFFGFKSERDVPQLIRTTEEAESKNDFTKFISFQNLWKDSKSRKIYKIQSREKLTEEDIAEMFISTDFIHQTHFPVAYPKLRVLSESDKLYSKICDGLYYNNTVETVSSAMEASCWAAKNSANLLVQECLSRRV